MPYTFAFITSPQGWLIVLVLGFLLFGRKFARWIGLPEWATFKIGERRIDLPLIVLFSIALGFVIGRITPTWSRPSPPRAAAPQSWPVVRVVSGDTIQVNYRGQPRTVHLMQVTPPPVGTEAYEEATETLRGLLEGKLVTLEFGAAGESTDRHMRLPAFVYADGININEEMIRRGW